MAQAQSILDEVLEMGGMTKNSKRLSKEENRRSRGSQTGSDRCARRKIIGLNIYVPDQSEGINTLTIDPPFIKIKQIAF